jgi:hypothetical protein
MRASKLHAGFKATLCMSQIRKLIALFWVFLALGVAASIRPDQNDAGIARCLLI